MSMSKRAYEASEEREERMRKHAPELYEALSGALHFDDGLIAHGVIGDALREWRKEARSVLAKIDGRQP